jgi:IMP dehydrogenase
MTGSLSAEAFFQSKTRDCIALTFADVRLDTGYADFLPTEASLEGRFSRNVPLLIPIVGAAMSSVVSIPMAIELAKWGGIASLPRSLDPDTQAKAAARVKHHIHGFIDDPIPARANESVAELLARREEKGWDFDSFPVLDAKRKLVGLMTHQKL